MLITFTGEWWLPFAKKIESGIDISLVIIFYGRSWLEFMMRRVESHVHFDTLFFRNDHKFVEIFFFCAFSLGT